MLFVELSQGNIHPANTSYVYGITTIFMPTQTLIKCTCWWAGSSFIHAPRSMMPCTQRAEAVNLNAWCFHFLYSLDVDMATPCTDARTVLRTEYQSNQFWSAASLFSSSFRIRSMIVLVVVVTLALALPFPVQAGGSPTSSGRDSTCRQQSMMQAHSVRFDSGRQQCYYVTMIMMGPSAREYSRSV